MTKTKRQSTTVPVEDKFKNRVGTDTQTSLKLRSEPTPNPKRSQHTTSSDFTTHNVELALGVEHDALRAQRFGQRGNLGVGQRRPVGLHVPVEHRSGAAHGAVHLVDHGLLQRGEGANNHAAHRCPQTYHSARCNVGQQCQHASSYTYNVMSVRLRDIHHRARVLCKVL